MTDFPRYEQPSSSESINPPTSNGIPDSTSQSGTGESTKDVAKDRAADVAQSGKEAASQLAGTAKEQAGQVAHEAKTQARDLLQQGRSEVTQQATQQQQRAAETLRTFSDQLSSMSRNADQPGLAQDLTSQVAQRTSALASWLEDREPASVLDDVRGFARRRPGTFIALCAAAGVVAGRLGRGLQADASSQSSTDLQSGASSSSTNGTAAVVEVPPTTAVYTTDSEPTLTAGTAVPPTADDEWARQRAGAGEQR